MAAAACDRRRHSELRELRAQEFPDLEQALEGIVALPAVSRDELPQRGFVVADDSGESLAPRSRA